MNTKLDKFDSGWIGISISFSSEEIEILANRFNDLKSGQINHFHLRNEDFTSEEGVADIEISMAGKGDIINMIIEQR